MAFCIGDEERQDIMAMYLESRSLRKSHAESINDAADFFGVSIVVARLAIDIERKLKRHRQIYKENIANDRDDNA